MRDRLRAVLWLACAVVVAGGSALRLTGLGWQSYWTDEAFTVVQCRSDWAMWWRMGEAEVHPPLFALLARAWIALVGDSPSHVRLLSALIGCLGAPVVWATLRRVALPDAAKVVLIAATTTNGMATTHAQDARSYALLWLAAVGLTAATLRVVVGLKQPHRLGWGSWLGWTLWAMLASATHLMGLALAGAAGLAIVALRPSLRRLGLLAVLLLEAALPQLAWLAHGLRLEGFPQNTAWIPAPGWASLADLLTTVFAWSGLRIEPTGFRWSSWWLLGLLAGVALGALGWRRWGGQRREPLASPLRRALVALALMGGVTILVTWVGSQWVHVWTLRGMIVVAPALTWVAVLAVVALAGRARAGQVAAGVTLVVLSVGALSVGQTLRTTTYKTDLAAVLDQVRAVRAQQPDALVVLSYRPSVEHWEAADRVGDRVDYRWLQPHTVIAPPQNYLAEVRPRPGTTLYAWYEEPEPAQPQRIAAVIAAGGGPPACRALPVVGVVVVRCDLPSPGPVGGATG